VHFYRWLECDGGRGPNELASCLADFLMKNILSFHDKGVKCIRLFCDSCSSQNKNYTMLLLFCSLAVKYGMQIQWVFPVRGHSYMPADRCFGLVEKKMKTLENVLNPENYDEVIEKIGTPHVFRKY
jgi:hypothetical protein